MLVTGTMLLFMWNAVFQLQNRKRKTNHIPWDSDQNGDYNINASKYFAKIWE